MSIYEVDQAVRDARATIEAGHRATRQCADTVVGTLRIAEVDVDTLVRLKRELQDFNAVTRRWKRKP